VPCGRNRVQSRACSGPLWGGPRETSTVDWPCPFHEGPIVLWTGRSGGPIGTKRLFARPEKQSNSAKVFRQQIGVDGEGGFRPFRGRDDHPLDGAGRVAGDVETPEVRRLVLAGPDGALFVEVAAERERELRLLCLAGREKERVARERIAALEHDLPQGVLPVETDHAILAHADPV